MPSPLLIESLHVYPTSYAAVPPQTSFVPIVRVTVPKGREALINCTQIIATQEAFVPGLVWKVRQVDAGISIADEAQQAADVILTPDGPGIAFYTSIGAAVRNLYVPENTRTIWGVLWNPQQYNQANSVAGNITGFTWPKGALTRAELLQLVRTSTL